MRELRALAKFLQLDSGWMKACRTMIFERPNLTRLQVQWTPKLLAEVEAGIEEFPHLPRYRQTKLSG